jgi:hypothetical protein
VLTVPFNFRAALCGDAEEEYNSRANVQIQVLTRIVAYLPVPGVGRKGALSAAEGIKVEAK